MTGSPKTGLKLSQDRVTPYYLFLYYSVSSLLHILFKWTQGKKFWKIWEYQTTWPASWEICMQVKKQQLELDMEQTGSK